jgi:glycosyltransferase involved in cell wall biosynthesis
MASYHWFVAKVLVVSAHLPFPPRWGFGTRVYQLMRQIASRHDATLLCYAAPGDENVERLRQEFPVEVVHRPKQRVLRKRASQLRSLASRVPYDVWTTHSREMQGVIDRLCAEHGFEIVQLESTLLELFRFPPESQIVLDEHNVDYEVYARMHETERSPLRRAFYRSQERRFVRFEQRSWQRVAAVVATSEREAEIMRRHAPDTLVTAVPNGVDVEYFRPDSAPVEPGTLVFNGVLDYRPNLDGVNFLVDEVLPLVREHRPDVKVSVVGRGSESAVEALRRRGVDATGEVPDVRPYLQGAEVVVVPIRMGSGTRLKVVEGLALGKPVVSTTLGCEGVNVRDGEHLLIGDTAEVFALQILHLFEHPEVGEALGRAGRELTEREYSWDYAGERLEEVYQLSLQGSAQPRDRVTT